MSTSNNDKFCTNPETTDKKNTNKLFMLITSLSFSPEDNLTPEEINRIGYEIMMELTVGRFMFIS